MTTHLNVLLVESHPGLGASAATALEAAGHQVHRCYEPEQRGFPCTALRGGDCPLDGPIDVAYLHRLPMTPRPTPLEDGVRCALRRQVPVVENELSLFDPYEEHVDGWVGPGLDVVAACETAAEHRFDHLSTDVLRRIGPLLQSAGIGPDGLACQIRSTGFDLDVHLTVGGPTTKHFDQSLAVRAMDAVRAAGQMFGQVDVHVHHATQEGPDAQHP